MADPTILSAREPLQLHLRAIAVALWQATERILVETADVELDAAAPQPTPFASLPHRTQLVWLEQAALVAARQPLHFFTERHPRAEQHDFQPREGLHLSAWGCEADGWFIRTVRPELAERVLALLNADSPPVGVVQLESPVERPVGYWRLAAWEESAAALAAQETAEVAR
jgi:hypothetical protein